MDSSNDKSDIDSIVKSCFETGSKIANSIFSGNTPCSNITNKANEIFGIHVIDFYKVTINLFELIVAYRGEPKDYSTLGCLQAYLGDYYLENKKEKIQLFNNAIHNLELTLKFGSKLVVNYYCLGISQSGLADLSKDEREKISLYQKAIDNLKEAIRIEKNPIIYSELSFSQVKLAQFLPREERIGLYKESISNLTEIIKLRRDASDYDELGSVQFLLANDLFDIEDRKKLKQRALINLKKSYELCKDECVLEIIQEIETSSF